MAKRNETKGFPVVEFVGLKSKMYSVIKENDAGDQKRKGINKNVKNVTHRGYKNALFEKKKKIKMKGKQSQSHQLGTSVFDNKQFMLANGIKTLSYGHKDIS